MSNVGQLLSLGGFVLTQLEFVPVNSLSIGVITLGLSMWMGSSAVWIIKKYQRFNR